MRSAGLIARGLWMFSRGYFPAGALFVFGAISCVNLNNSAAPECTQADCADSGGKGDSGPDAAVGTRVTHFAGVTSVAPASTTSLQVTWDPGSDTDTPPPQLRYEIFLSSAPTPIAFDQAPAATSAGGALVQTLTELTPNQEYSVAVRLLATDGVEDTNQVTMMAKTVADTQPPTFVGAMSAFNAGGGLLRVTWNPASDDLTPPPGIVYVVYAGTTPGDEDFANPVATTACGAASADVTELSLSTFYFVVRARDAAGNVDSNTTEVSAQSGASFAYDVQPIFTVNCGVPGCHVPGNPIEGEVLVAGYAYASIVNVPSTEVPALFRVQPNDPPDSYLYQKIMGTAKIGTQMPAPATGNVLTDAQKGLIQQWIQQGALDN